MTEAKAAGTGDMVATIRRNADGQVVDVVVDGGTRADAQAIYEALTSASKMNAHDAGSTNASSAGSRGWIRIQAGEGQHPIAVGNVLVHVPTKVRYKTSLFGEYTDGDLCPVTSVDEGAATNMAPGTELEWVVPIPGIALRAIVAEEEGGITGGTGDLVQRKAAGRVVKFCGVALPEAAWTSRWKAPDGRSMGAHMVTVDMPMKSFPLALVDRFDLPVSGVLEVPGLGTFEAVCMEWLFGNPSQIVFRIVHAENWRSRLREASDEMARATAALEIASADAPTKA